MSQNSVIKPEEVLEWKTNPVTKSMFSMLSSWREELRDRLEEGLHLFGTEARAIQAQLSGSLLTIKKLQDLDADMLNTQGDQ